MIKGTFLGTGSIPTFERNSHGVLLEFNNMTSILIDCGEGIQRQLLKVDTDLSKLNTIFITHEHIDHVYGVGGVLTLLLNRYPEKEVTIYAPNEAISIIKGLAALFLEKKQARIKYFEVKDGQKIETDIFSCLTFKTFHTESSIGYLFQLESGKVALSGDIAIPNHDEYQKLIESFSGADIAIIDAVHITVNEASSIAKEANIHQLYLLPILLYETKEGVCGKASKHFANSCIPDDFDQFVLK